MIEAPVNSIPVPTSISGRIDLGCPVGPADYFALLRERIEILEAKLFLAEMDDHAATEALRQDLARYNLAFSAGTTLANGEDMDSRQMWRSFWEEQSRERKAQLIDLDIDSPETALTAPNERREIIVANWRQIGEATLVPPPPKIFYPKPTPGVS